MEKIIQIAIENGWKKELLQRPLSVWEIDYVTYSSGKKLFVWFRFGERHGTGSITNRSDEISQEEICLDPLFWKAFDKHFWKADSSLNDYRAWRTLWYSFIDHLADGKDIESFFEELIK